MTCWSAAGIHLGISAVVAAIVLALIYMVWYPAPYFESMGGQQLVLVVVGVDVAIGPLLTLIIFKSGKPGLRFDLGVIAFLQSMALAYGVSVAAQARPVYSVFVVDRFETVAANAIDPDELAKVTRTEFKSPPWLGPRTVGVVKPTENQEAARILFAMTGGAGPAALSTALRAVRRDCERGGTACPAARRAAPLQSRPGQRNRCFPGP
jgi:hypothetical protein